MPQGRPAGPARRGEGLIPVKGHRALPHTADARIEAWAPTAAECIAEAIRAMIEGFADLGHAESDAVQTVRIGPGFPEDQLVTALDEVIYRMDTTARIPCGVEAGEDQSGLWLRLDMADVATISQIGALPKAVALHDLRFLREPRGWTCAVTLDV